jgi:hypothetical protein
MGLTSKDGLQAIFRGGEQKRGDFALVTFKMKKGKQPFCHTSIDSVPRPDFPVPSVPPFPTGSGAAIAVTLCYETGREVKIWASLYARDRRPKHKTIMRDLATIVNDVFKSG